ncbi:BlaI/MecI/CopY family transcriptional regulator [Bdellovibrio sp. HCB2-146]|uniref:BlaI/MecI/CopY family transcriptional regulator n=1 Tax=Bdellovibrio sp. HCB2-146 TaxID=3394362 RepID=UPI0039BD330B
MKSLPSLGEQEIEILRFVSSQGQVSVREAAAHFEQEKGLARTTILTVLERLRNKGFLSREKVDGVFRYSEKIDTGLVMKGKVAEFVERTLGGSVSPLLNYFAGGKNLSADEIEKLRDIIADFDKSNRGKGR